MMGKSKKNKKENFNEHLYSIKCKLKLFIIYYDGGK